MARIAVVVTDPAGEEGLAALLRGAGHVAVPLSAAAGATDDAIARLAVDLIVVDGARPDAARLAALASFGAVVLVAAGSRAPAPHPSLEPLFSPYTVEGLAAAVGRRLGRPEALRLFDRYRPVRELGRGGFGAVLEAVDVETDEPVALKVPAPPRDAAEALRFVREAYSLAAIKSPHVVAIRRVGLADGRPFYAMELVPGEDLRRRVARTGPLPEASARGLLIGLLRALEALRARGFLHRDVKPDNVILRRDDPARPVLVDFGLARLVEDVGLTAADVILGSPFFLAPESVSDGKVDHRSDLFSAGLTARWALTGETGHPSTAQGLAMLELVQRGPAPLDPRVAPGLARHLDALCARDPRDRPATAAEALQALGAAGAARRRTPIPVERDTSAWRVLVVDDDFAVREAARRCLERAGFSVVTAGSAEDALSVLDVLRARADAALVDLRLPGLGGRQLVERLRQVAPGLAVVVMTGNPLEAQGIPGVQLLPKPFTPLAIATAVAEAIAGRDQGV